MGRMTPAGILLILVNLGFVVAGIMLIKFTIDLNATGWLDALDETEYESTAGTVITAVQGLGVCAIALALIGIIGAIVRSRVLLMIYAFTMIAAMIVFGVIGGTAFSFNSKMKNWQSNAFPAETTESEFAPKFNEIYCYAQGAYFCNNATTKDLAAIFLPNVPAPALALLPPVQGLNSLCASKALSAISDMASVCKACAEAQKFAKFEKILTWADEKCPRTATTSMWCAAFLESGKPGAVYVNSPYKQCRESFLEVAVSWGNSLTMMGALAAVVAAVLLALSCFARRSRPEDDGHYKV